MARKVNNNPFGEMDDMTVDDDDFVQDGGNEELQGLEHRLSTQVDDDFFDDPQSFHTLHRVIDVLGAQMMDGTGNSNDRHHQHQFASDYDNLRQYNPAYKALKQQQAVVEEAVEIMSVRYCGELNSSVVQIGKVARQFRDAVSMVRQLRRSVRDIKETLGSGNTSTSSASGGAGQGGGANGTSNGSKASAAQAAAMSLRELWLKKLECEAVLMLLEKMEIVRAAPVQYDYLVAPPNCRIGAAVLTLSRAFDIACSPDFSSVQALQNITKQISDRKQQADAIIWDTLWDVLYLRTANAIIHSTRRRNVMGGVAMTAATGAVASPDDDKKDDDGGKDKSGGGGGGGPRSSVTGKTTATSSATVVSQDSRSHIHPQGMKNPFLAGRGVHNRLGGMATHMIAGDDDDISIDSYGSGASLFSRDDRQGSSVNGGAAGGTAPRRLTRMMIPPSLLEAELDLEADEQRCLEEASLAMSTSVADVSSVYYSVAGSEMSAANSHHLPRYADHVLATRILVECLAKLGRLDDVQYRLDDTLRSELRSLAQMEQQKTMQRLELQQGQKQYRRQLLRSYRSGGAGVLGRFDLKQHRRHLTGLLSSFGCVMIRLSHLAQIFRHRITSDRNILLRSYDDKSTALDVVLSNAYDIMQREIKDFLKGCLLEETEEEKEDSIQNKPLVEERGLFSLGITNDPNLDSSNRNKDNALSNAGGSNKLGHKLNAQKFVTHVLMPQTHTHPQVRHALEFRRSIAKWTTENSALRKELGLLSGEDLTAPSKTVPRDEELALKFLDGIIKRQLIPVLQKEAIDGTTDALEKDDAFDPILDRGVFGRPTSNEPQDVDMCYACTELYRHTGPLFMALHRLPKDEKMYLHLVGVLEHTILTFISRVKPRVAQICNDKTALRLLLDSSRDKDGKDKSFGAIIERRKAFAQLLQAYADGDLLESTAQMDGTDGDKDPNLTPLSPHPGDTKAKNGGAGGSDAKAGADALDLMGGVEKEEQILALEMVHLHKLTEFSHSSQLLCCSDEELMKASVLAHSLLKLSSLLESRLKVRTGNNSFETTLTSTRALREAIKTIKAHGIKMAKFCRVDMLMQNISRLQKICKSSTIVAKDAVRIPSCVNDLGEYLTGASDNLREAGGNAVTAYTLSSLEQYIPLCLMQTVRVIARGEGIVSKSPLTLNGVEALDRSGSVLYRDLKGATSFDNSFWDDELAAISFERSASFMAMLEVEMDELEAYYRSNAHEFAQSDFELMFNMTGPRRKGDVGRYHLLRKKLGIKN